VYARPRWTAKNHARYLMIRQDSWRNEIRSALEARFLRDLDIQRNVFELDLCWLGTQLYGRNS